MTTTGLDYLEALVARYDRGVLTEAELLDSYAQKYGYTALDQIKTVEDVRQAVANRRAWHAEQAALRSKP